LGKLRRFVFEQRGRVLQRLANLRATKASALEHVSGMQPTGLSAGDLLDVAAENARLVSLLETLGADPQLAVAANEGASATIKNALSCGFQNNETLDQIAARVRVAYNELVKRL
jgi:hypothetical protein